MTSEFISARKHDLLKRKTELEEQLKGFAEKKNNDDWETQFPKMTDVPEDKVDEVEEYENLLPVEYALEKDLKEINEALERIENGSYGKCANCGGEIGEERLSVLPQARTCSACE